MSKLNQYVMGLYLYKKVVLSDSDSKKIAQNLLIFQGNLPILLTLGNVTS